ncbi:MAG: lytic transglycosylase domain-containing protein [Pseudomonadota bacterium]
MYSSHTCHAANIERCQRLVNEAQVLFQSGTSMHQQGYHDMALDVFEKSHELLLAAEMEGPSYIHNRLDNVFTAYYAKLHAMAPELSEELTMLRSLSRAIFSEEDIEQGKIQAHMDNLLTYKREFLISGFRKAQYYLPMIKEEFARQGLPANLAYIAFIESCFEPEALSHAGARGMWQFMPATARAYGLEVSDVIDERLDPEKSTVAAAKYLKKLYAQFGNWPLAIAAYNCGENRLAKALRTTASSTFWDLVALESLPAETQDYVPRFIAVNIISSNLNQLQLH